jgi:hypothetical protein
VPKKKVYYPSKSQVKRRPGAGPEGEQERPNLARINPLAVIGQAGLSVGDRVRIEGVGTYSGEEAVIERLAKGVIPSAVVRTASGATRQVRTIDLVPLSKEQPTNN